MINKRQVDFYKIIQKGANNRLAEKYVEYASAMNEKSKGGPAPKGKRGALAGRLDEAIGDLDSMSGPVKARHVLLLALTGSSHSTKYVTGEQASYLLGITSTKDENGNYGMNFQVAEELRVMTIALLKASVQFSINKEEDMPGPQPPRAGPPNPGVAQEPDGPPTPRVAQEPDGPPTPRAEHPQSGSDQGRQVALGVDEQKASMGLEAVQEAQWHSEAPVSASTTVSHGGYEWLVTIRAGVTGEMFLGMGVMLNKAVRWFEKNGFEPSARFSAISSSGNAQAPSQQAPAHSGVLSEGTAALEWIQVTAEGKVQFKAKGFEWPFQDSRGADVVAAIFDENTGITADHLRQPTAMRQEDFIQWYGKPLFVDFVHKQKGEKAYWDATRVHF